MKIIIFIYFLVGIRVLILQIKILLGLFKLTKGERLSLIILVLRAIIFWPMDFIDIPRLLVGAYLFANMKAHLLLGQYYGKKIKKLNDFIRN